MGTWQEALAEHLTSQQLAERLRNPLLVEAPAALGTSKIKEMLIKAARSFYRAASCRIGRRKAASSFGQSVRSLRKC